MKSLWALMKWSGRAFSWVVLPPLGALQSWRHGRNKRHRELITAIRDSSVPPWPT